jgi:anti-sigma regulatory factor (Ser/Thr protein kinase)
MTTGHGPDLLDDAPASVAGERALLWQASGQARRMLDPESLRAFSSGGSVRLFPGTPDQVRAVRQFVRRQLAGHPAADNATLIASELTANSIVHSATSRPGGQFLIHAAVASEHRAALIVTDQGGPFNPGRPAPGQRSESGRGLTVIRSLTSLFRIHSHASGHRSFIALITTTPDTAQTAQGPACGELT